MEKSKEQPGMMLYFDALRPAISRLDEAHCGMLLRALLDYAQYGVLPELDPMTGLAFDMLVPKIDRDAKRYEESREQRRYAAYVRERKNRGDSYLSIEMWRLKQIEAEYGSNGPQRPVNGPYPSTSASASIPASASATASAATSAPASASTFTFSSASTDAAGEGSKGEGEAQLLYEQWLRALDDKDRERACKLSGRLYFLGYCTDDTTRKMKKRMMLPKLP